MSWHVAKKAFAAALFAGAAGTLGIVPAAYAAYPGTNGDIAISSTRNANIAIYQVDPSDPNLGSPSGDQSATSGLTLGGADVEPFYGPDGQTVYFSSDRDAANEWAIFSISQATPESAPHPALELSAVPGSEAHNDYAPSVAPDKYTVVFNRDNTSIDTLWSQTAPSSVCTLYTPPRGLAPAMSDGSGDRPVFDPVDPSKLLYVGADGQIHLLSGIKFTAGSNPCASGQSGLTDTDLSAEAFPSTSQYATGDDASPDWSPNGQSIVFSSTRGGGDTLFLMNLTTSPPTGNPIWPSLAQPNATQSTEPVFSPDGTQIAFVQPRKGTQIFDEMLVSQANGTFMGNGTATDLSEQMSSGISFDSEPDWQPLANTPPVLPEAPFAAALPAAALVIGGVIFGLRQRRSHRRQP
jgi:Tol biopolymer transport system component